MGSTAARQGYPAKIRRDEAEAARKKAEEVRLFLENPVWAETVQELRDAYLDALVNCPEKDDKMRYQLQMALKVFKKVENHIEAAHNRADFSSKKAIKADFGKKSLFRR